VSTPSEDIVERLAKHKTLGSAPREELEWLASRGEFRHLDPGEVLTAPGAPVEGMWIVMTGRLAIYIDRGAGRNKAFEWPAGDVSGMLPYSRLVNSPGESIAAEPTELFVVPLKDVALLPLQCQKITAILVHTMLDRSRIFTSSDLQDEKMISLGKLSAGLAHELNNPASAIERSAALIGHRLTEAEEAARVVGAAKLGDAQLAAIDAVRVACSASPSHGVRSPLQRAKSEELIETWLMDHGVDPAIAGPLADAEVTVGALDQVAGSVQGPPLAAALQWVAAGLSVRQIAAEIQEAATRITGLVMAVKGFTHMDQASVAAPVDLRTSLGNTVAVLTAKAKSKSAEVAIRLEENLPQACGFAGELNQIWANLIDNALDAIPSSGRVEITANRERQRVVVRVIDNGSGIPPNIRDRIFDPFVTTKPVGKGTGLGLDIVRRLVIHNDGEIQVESVPGRTEFRVILPVAEAGRDGGASQS
jgi:signal transduction histidine kinase